MKKIHLFLGFALMVLLAFGGTAEAFPARPGVIRSSGALETMADGADQAGAVRALEARIDAGERINGAADVRIARPGVRGKATSEKFTLAPTPSELCTLADYNANLYRNPLCYKHPVLISTKSGSLTLTDVTSSRPGVVKVITPTESGDPYFTIEGVGKGTATLTATASNGKKATRKVTVKGLVCIASFTLYSNQTGSFKRAASGNLAIAAGGTAEFRLAAVASPTSASFGGQLVQYDDLLTPPAARAVSSDMTVAVVSEQAEDESLGFKVVARKPGTAVLTVRATDGGKAKATFKLTVKGGPVTEIRMPDDFTIQPGATLNIPPSVLPATAWDKTLVWGSSNKKTIAVDQKGNVTALKPGSATITCRNKASGKTGSVVVTAAYDYAASRTVHRFYGVSLKSGTYSSYKNTAGILAFIFDGQMGSGTSRYEDLSSASAALSYLQGIAGEGMDEQDVTVVYLAGHAAQATDPASDGALYCEAQPNEYLTVGQVRSALENVPGTVIVLVDADYSGAFIGSKGAAAPKALALAGQKAFHRAWAGAFATGASGLSAKAPAGSDGTGKLKVMTSCVTGRAYSNDRYRWFGYWLAKGLGGQFGGDGAYTGYSQGIAPASKDEVVTLDELYGYVKAGIQSEATVTKWQTVSVWPPKDPTAVLYALEP